MKDLKLILFLLIIITLCTLLLSFAQFFFEKASVVFSRRLYAEILNLYGLEHTEETIDEDFSEAFRTVQSGDKTYYISRNTAPATIVFEAQGPGLWSTIEIFLSINMDEESIYGLRIVSQGETPGLGARIAEPEFLSRFTDLDINPSVEIVKFALASNEVDAISGATKTSTALEVIINRGIAELRKNMEYLNLQVEEE